MENTRRNSHGPVQWLLIAVSACALCIPGCKPQMSDDTDVKVLEKSWPQYKAPHLNTPLNMNVWPNTLNRSREQRHQAGIRPKMEAPQRVVTPFEEWSLSDTAIDALARIGAPAVGDLKLALRDPDPRVRFQAARILARIGPDAQSAVPSLVRNINDESPQVRRASVHALGQIGPEAGNAVGPLLELVKESARQVVTPPAENSPSQPGPSQNPAVLSHPAPSNPAPSNPGN